MKFMIMLVLAAALVPGCAQFTPTGSCVDGDSVILTVTGGNPTGLEKGFLLTNFAGLERGLFTAEQAADFFDSVEDKAQSGISYVQFANWLGAEIETINRYLGAAMIIGGADIPAMGSIGGAATMSECDLQLLEAHITHQRDLIALYGGVK